MNAKRTLGMCLKPDFSFSLSWTLLDVTDPPTIPCDLNISNEEFSLPDHLN